VTRFVDKRVADLVPGDRIEGYGPVRYLEWLDGQRFPEVIVWTTEEGVETGWGHSWPSEAVVKVEVPLRVRLQPFYANSLGMAQWVATWRYSVLVDDGSDDPVEVAMFRSQADAVDYVERLNADPDLIRRAVVEPDVKR
jgi:hypothetical protein